MDFFGWEDLDGDGHVDEVESLLADDLMCTNDEEREMNDGIGIRGSSNQTLHVFKHRERYCGLDTCKREVQNILYGNKLITIGIPEVK